MRPYLLASGAYACVTRDGTIFLDLVRDAYVGIDVEQARSLAPLVEGWPTPDGIYKAPVAAGADAAGADAPSVDAATAADLAQHLRARGLLVGQAETGHAHRTPQIPEASTDLIAWDEMTIAGFRPHHIFSFVRAFLAAWITLHCLSMNAAVRRCLRRRHASPVVCASFDTDRAKTLVSIYTHLRTIAFSRRGRCLLDSLVLVEFLAAYRVHPNWVIGVQSRPFSAHSWVQYGPWVLNGTPAFVRSYNPILVI